MLLKIAAVIGLLLVISFEINEAKEDLKFKNDTKFLNFMDDFNIFLKNKSQLNDAYDHFKDAEKKISDFLKDPNRKIEIGLNPYSHLDDAQKKKTLFGNDEFNITFTNITKRDTLNTVQNILLNGKPTSIKINLYGPTQGYVPPKSIDWVQKGFKTPVRSQDPCGNCWAFASAGALEAAIFKQYNTLVTLSPQLLTDCDKNNNACDGGNAIFAYDYVYKNGISADSFYPFVASSYENVFQSLTCVYQGCPVKPRTCSYSGFSDTTRGQLYKVSELYWVRNQPDVTLMEILDKFGPAYVAIDALNDLFTSYRGGIFAHPSRPQMCTTKTNHAVLLVGYGQEANGDKYWLIKNSWSTYWGMDGYMKISRDSPNNCGITTSVVVPILDLTQSPAPAPAPSSTSAPTPAPTSASTPAPTPSNLICDGNIHSNPGCATGYSCYYSSNSRKCSGMYSSVQGSCGPSYACKSESTWNGCKSEGTFLTESCSRIVQCKLNKNTLTAPTGFLIDDSVPAYRNGKNWKCPY